MCAGWIRSSLNDRFSGALATDIPVWELPDLGSNLSPKCHPSRLPQYLQPPSPPTPSSCTPITHYSTDLDSLSTPFQRILMTRSMPIIYLANSSKYVTSRYIFSHFSPCSWFFSLMQSHATSYFSTWRSYNFFADTNVISSTRIMVIKYCLVELLHWLPTVFPNALIVRYPTIDNNLQASYPPAYTVQTNRRMLLT